MRKRLGDFVFLLLLGLSVTAYSKPEPWDSLGSNMFRSAFGFPLLLHVSGGLATYGLMESNTDAQVSRAVYRQHPVLNASISTPGALMGALMPVALPATLYFFPKNEDWRNTGAVAMQAVGISFLYNNILKASTSRAPPEPGGEDPESLSRDFKFGFLRRGVIYGWPSGHTMVNTAMATSIFAYHREESWALPSGLAYSTYIGVSMTLVGRGGAHWLSEAVAGFIMGVGIGWTVGDSFYRTKPGQSAQANKETKLTLLPVARNETGILALYSF